ncbi:MAG TPA: Rid family hydrolase [Allosphingosinicella sp.]
MEGFFGVGEAPPPCFAWSPSPANAGENLGRRLFALLLAAALTTPALAGERQRSTVLMSENPQGRKFQEEWGYSDAVVAGDSIYLSGIVVGQRDGEALEAAYERAYRQVEAILKRAGASWDDVVDITSFHTDVAAQMPAIAAVHKRFVKAPYPAWTAIDVDRLIPERGITEIKVVARRPGGGRGK